MNALSHAQPHDASSGRRARKLLQRDIDRSHKEKNRAKITKLDEQLEHARAAHQKALEGAAERCRALRKAVSEKNHAKRAQAFAELRAELRQEGDAERAEARTSCSIDKDEVERTTGAAVQDAREELAEERSYQRGLEQIERGNRARKRGTKRASAAEKRSESDDEVRQNIPPELVPLFERIKRSIRGGPRESRTEAFLKYVEEHPQEYLDAIEDRTEAMIREMESQQRRGRRRNPATATAAKKQYKRDHWGRVGDEKVRRLLAADPNVPSVELGELVAVVYRTRKGDDKVLTDYEHEFSTPRPRLAYNEGGLLICGGRYRVETRGIVG